MKVGRRKKGARTIIIEEEDFEGRREGGAGSSNDHIARTGQDRTADSACYLLLKFTFYFLAFLPPRRPRPRKDTAREESRKSSFYGQYLPHSSPFSRNRDWRKTQKCMQRVGAGSVVKMAKYFVHLPLSFLFFLMLAGGRQTAFSADFVLLCCIVQLSI